MVFLETARLRLRNVHPHDADEMTDYRNDERCSKYQRDQVRDPNGIVRLIEKRQHDTLTLEAPAMIAVALQQKDALIGEIVVMPCDGTISLGYTFSYKVHRNGYGFEALSALIDCLHEHFPEWDSICFTDAENIPSMRLLEKLGYSNLGYLPAKDAQVFGKWLRKKTMDEIVQLVR